MAEVTPNMAVAFVEEVLRNYKDAKKNRSGIFTSYYGWSPIEGLATALYLLNEEARLAVISSLWDGLLEAGVIERLAYFITHYKSTPLPLQRTIRLITERAVEDARSEDGWRRRASHEVLKLVAQLQEVPLDLLPEEVVATKEVLEELAENKSVPAEYIVKVLGRLEALPKGVAYYLAERRDMPPDVLRSIHGTYGNDSSVIIRLADNPSTPPDVLEKIAERERMYKDVHLRQSLAANPNTPPRFLDRYAFDDLLRVRKSALSNPSLPAETARKAYKLADRNRHRHDILTVLAENPSCPEDILMALVFDRSLRISSAARETLAKLGRLPTSGAA